MPYDPSLLINCISDNLDTSKIFEKYENYDTHNFVDTNPFKYYVSKDIEERFKERTIRAEHNVYLITDNRVKVITKFGDDFARAIRYKSNEVLQKFKGPTVHISLVEKMKKECENEMQKFMTSLGFKPEEYLIECYVRYETHLHSRLNIDICASRILDGTVITNLTNLDFETYEYIGLMDGAPFQLFEGTELRKVQGAKIYKFLKD